jgi:hypothetical protein
MLTAYSNRVMCDSDGGIGFLARLLVFTRVYGAAFQKAAVFKVNIFFTLLTEQMQAQSASNVRCTVHLAAEAACVSPFAPVYWLACI